MAFFLKFMFKVFQKTFFFLILILHCNVGYGQVTDHQAVQAQIVTTNGDTINGELIQLLEGMRVVLRLSEGNFVEYKWDEIHNIYTTSDARVFFKSQRSLARLKPFEIPKNYASFNVGLAFEVNDYAPYIMAGFASNLSMGTKILKRSRIGFTTGYDRLNWPAGNIINMGVEFAGTNSIKPLPWNYLWQMGYGHAFDGAYSDVTKGGPFVKFGFEKILRVKDHSAGTFTCSLGFITTKITHSWWGGWPPTEEEQDNNYLRLELRYGFLSF
ncbi:MAG: hypothetical protein ACI8ZN_002395 [Bacteroidia bacterium]|jgi:hypothetical protein